MSRPTIFLDIDEVMINSSRVRGDINACSIPGKRVEIKIDSGDSFEDTFFKNFFADAVNHLNELVNTTDAQIVISSQWRIDKTVDQLKSLMSKYEFAERIIDTTPWRSTSSKKFHQKVKDYREWLEKNGPKRSFRNIEILYWISTNLQGATNFVILDDADYYDLEETFPGHFVKVDPYSLLTKEDVDKAKKILL